MDCISSLSNPSTNDTINMKPPGMTDGHTGFSSIHNGIHHSKRHPRKLTKANYKCILPSPECQSYLQANSINGSLHILTASSPSATIDIPSDNIDLHKVCNIFSAFPDLPMETPNACLHAYPTVDSKADTLTQSQCCLIQIKSNLSIPRIPKNRDSSK